MSFTDHTQCVAPKDYAGNYLGSAGMYAAVVAAIVALFLDPGAITLALIIGGIGYCRWWLFGRLVCLDSEGGNRCIIGLAMGVYDQKTQVGFLAKFDTDFSVNVLLAPSLLTDSIQGVAANNAVQGHMIQDQRFCDNPVNPLAGDLVTMYQNYSNLSFEGEPESPADLVGAAGEYDQHHNLNIAGQGVLTPQQGASLGLAAPGALNTHGLVVPNDWHANTYYVPGDQISDSNGNLEQCTAYGAGTSAGSSPAWPGQISISSWTLGTPGGTSFSFVANNSNAVGDTIRLTGFRDSLFFNNQIATITAANATGFTATVAPLPVGSEVPAVGTQTESGSGLTVGALTSDGEIQWSCVGHPPAGVGTFEVEFEGSGVWDLYVALLAATVPAAIGAVACLLPVVGWLACLILSLIALAIVGIGAAVAQSDSPNETVSGGVLHPGQDVIFVMGRWIMDAGHQGWNELHPVLAAQKIGSVDHANVATGNPWIGTDFADPVMLQTKLDAMCGLTAEAGSAVTVVGQAEPQNQWTIHPFVDGCTPAAPVIL